jgi:hypothetical protein
MKNIDSDMLENITGGNLALTAATTAGRPGRGSSSSTLQTALTGVTSALDTLKQNQNNGGSLQQMLPIVMMAKWIQNR